MQKILIGVVAFQQDLQIIIHNPGDKLPLPPLEGALAKIKQLNLDGVLFTNVINFF